MNRLNDLGCSAHFCGGGLPPRRNVSITRRLNSATVEASVILKLSMLMRTHPFVRNKTGWIHQPSRWFLKTCGRATSRPRFPWALSTRNHAGAIDGWREGYGVANSSVAGFWKDDPLPNCNSSVTGFSQKIGRDPIDTSEPVVLIYAPAAGPLDYRFPTGSSWENPE